MKRALLSSLLALGFGSAALSLSGLALADDEATRAAHLHAPLPGYDGVYGRFDGSLTLAASAGAELEDGEPRGALKIAAHYMWTAGVYARYADAFGNADQRSTRVASLGVDVRPLFLPRFARDYEHGPALLDLTLDSLSLSAGAYFGQPRSRDFGDERGFEIGLGFGIPLLSEARGPWLEARAERRFADRGENAWLFTLALAYHALTWSTTPDDP
jgi:hypothetical protein